MLKKNLELHPLNIAGDVRLIHIMLLACILMGGAWLRVHALGKTSYWYDEICSVLYARGQTAAIFTAPQGYFEHAPAVASAPGMRSWKNVWLGFDTTPPLYPSLLRLWWQAFGDGDVSGRMLSVVFSVLTIAALFDLARLILTPTLALWASALCAASPPIVRYAQEARAYALVGLLGVLACDIAVRIALFGGRRGRYLLLWLVCATALLTHYFIAGGIAGIMLFAIIELRGPARIKLLCTLAASFVVACGGLVWLWLHASMMHQGNEWLAEPAAGLWWTILVRITRLPVEFLIRPMEMTAVCTPAGMLLFVPLFLRRSRPAFLLVALWPLGIISLIAASDLWQHQDALGFDRYTLAAAPMVFISLVATADLIAQWIPRALPALARISAWVRHGLPAATVAGALLSVPGAYTDQLWVKPESRQLARDIREHVKPEDVLVIESAPDMHLYDAGVIYLNMDYYDGPLPFATAILESPASDAMRRQIWSHNRVWVLKCFPVGQGNKHKEFNGYIGSYELTPAGSMRMFAGRLYRAEALK